MKQQWAKFAARFDALSLRERVLVFVAAVGAVLFLAYMAGMGPMLAKQSTLRGQIRQQQNNLAGLDGEIMAKIKAYQVDPDEATRQRLAAVHAESARLGDSLSAMQKGLVAPERMAPLIDTILRSNGRLRLVAMKTLPVGSLNEGDPKEAAGAQEDASAVAQAQPATEVRATEAKILAAAAKPAAPHPLAANPAVAPKPGSLLYRHGVEITVRGNYLDMIDYMAALEVLPTQLFWGGAQLEVEEYPTARLTLTLYTLSLDPKWMKL